MSPAPQFCRSQPPSKYSPFWGHHATVHGEVQDHPQWDPRGDSRELCFFQLECGALTWGFMTSILNVWHWDIGEHIKIRLIRPVQSDHYSLGLGDKSPIDLSEVASKILPEYQSARPKLSHAPALALLPRARGAWKKSGKSPQSIANSATVLL